MIKEAIIYKENDAFTNLSGHVESNPLYATFIQPFTDIVQTGAYAVKRVGAVTTNELQSILKQAAVAAVPFISAETMDEIKASSRQELSAALSTLDKEYANVINRNIDALIDQTDVWGLAFLFNPGMLLGSKLLMKTPEIAASFIGTIVGGAFGKQLQAWANELQQINQDPASVFFSQRQHGSGGQYGGTSTSVDWGAGQSGGSGGGYDYGYDIGDMGGYLEEQQQQQQSPQIKDQIKQWVAYRKKQLRAAIQKQLKNPKVAASISSSSIGQQMQQTAINTTVKAAKNNLAFNDWNQMLQKHSKNQKLKALDKQLTDGMKKQNMTDEQITQAKNKMVPTIKEQMKNMLVQQIQKYGLQGNSKYGQQAVSKAIQQIKSIH